MLRAENISKSFEGIPAVDGIDLTINEGEFYGLLGPNGAGKTTTINMISTLLKPDTGFIYINGKNTSAHKKEVKMIMGIVPQEIALYDDMKAYDNLLFWGGLYGLKGEALKKRVNELLEWMELSDRKNEKLKTYSGGMKRRINIAAALLHDPQLLVMDEPTVGIDPQSRNKIYDILTELHRRGKTILYTTHYMQEAENMCDRIGIIDKGKLIIEGSLAELKSKTGVEESVVIGWDSSGAAPATLKNFPYNFSITENELHIFSRQIKNQLPDIIAKCFEAGIIIRHIDIRGINLETIFLNMTGRKLRDQ